MISLNLNDPFVLTVFWLSFTRWVCTFMVMPVMNESFIPMTVKVLFCFVLSFAFFDEVRPFVARDLQMFPEGGFWFLTLYYAVSGIILGFLAKCIMLIFVSAGTLITQQIGFSSITLYNPTYSMQSTPIEHIIHWTLIVMIISSGALLPMFKGVFLSFDSLSFFKANLSAKTLVYLNGFFKELLKTALLLSTPVIITTLFVNSVLGVVTRFVPQMNVFVISFVVNIGFGLLVLYFISTEFFYQGYQIYVKKLGEWFSLVV